MTLISRLCLLFIVLPLSAEAAPPKVIALVADIWCPYNCNPDDDLPGYAVDIATEVFAQHEYQVSYQLLPWSRAIEMTRAGDFDGIIGAIPIEAEDFHFGMEPIGQVRHTLYTLRDSAWVYDGLTSLQNIRLGAIQDYSYGTDVTGYIENNRSDEQVSIIGGEQALMRLLQMLRSGRIDAFVEDNTVFRYYETLNGQSFSVRQAGVAASGPIYIAFSPDNPDSEHYQQWLDDGIQQLRESGRLQVILTRYGLKDWR